jgi:hypothetical protein
MYALAGLPATLPAARAGAGVDRRAGRAIALAQSRPERRGRKKKRRCPEAAASRNRT